MISTARRLFPAILAGVLAAAPALADDAPKLDTGDTAWMLTSSAIVLMMTIPGLALFYGGMVRRMNVLSMMMQSFACCALITVLWVVAGYSLAFTEGGAFIGGLSKAMLAGIAPDTLQGTIPELLFMMFQMTFAIITPALITGAIAERMKFSALLVFMGLWSLLVYAPVAHWVWGPGGFLGGAGVLDFAGGTVVHINSGISALVLALVVGKRVGYGRVNFAPHNLVYTVIGAALLWVGWFGFNAGSALAANGLATAAFVTTQVATAAAALAWMAVEWATKGKPSVLGIASGAVAGLVAITPAAGFVSPTGALLIGFAGGVVCFWGATWLKHKLGLDDSLDVFPVHGMGGITGAILTGVFATEAFGGKSGLIDGNGAQVLLQIMGVGVTALYAGVVSFILIKAIDLVMGIRVGEEDEREGLDIRAHGESVA